VERVSQQPGYVLHARPYRETSLLLECLTHEHGRVGLVARGVRRERGRWPRALLQPLVPLQLSWTGRGELATLSGIDAAGPPFALEGEGLLCALYVNELVLRLCARGDAHPRLLGAYSETLARLAVGAGSAWTLRRFERDLLAELGYGLVCGHDADAGEALDAAVDYVYVADQGPRRWNGQAGVLRLRGSAFLALEADSEPDAADLAALRRLMRHVIGLHLGGASLRSWSLLAGAAAGERAAAASGRDPA
jgi:DNA repair protein RecO (recombination protein O)